MKIFWIPLVLFIVFSLVVSWQTKRVPVLMVVGYAFIIAVDLIWNRFLSDHFLINLLIWCPLCMVLSFWVTRLDLRRGR